MDRQGYNDEFAALEENFSGYEVYDQSGNRLGDIDDLFVDENDRPEYVGVNMGTGTTLIPLEAATMDETQRRIVVNAVQSQIQSGPAYSSDADLTPEFEQQVYAHYGLTRAAGGGSTGYGDYYGAEGTQTTTETTGTTSGTTSGTVGTGMTMGDTESGRFDPHGPGQEGVGVDDDKSDLEDEDELRVTRSEEELRAGTREREAGAMRVRKRVRTDRERLEVPVRREEVSVERVPVNEAAPSDAVIGEDEVSVPVVEEEVVVDKQAVIKEEVRIRKDVVQDTEVVEEDVRREEVDVEDATETRRPDTGV